MSLQPSTSRWHQALAVSRILDQDWDIPALEEAGWKFYHGCYIRYREPPKFFVRAKSAAATVHYVSGRIKYDNAYNYETIEEAREHLVKNGWEVLEIIKNEEQRFDYVERD